MKNKDKKDKKVQLSAICPLTQVTKPAVTSGKQHQMETTNKKKNGFFFCISHVYS